MPALDPDVTPKKREVPLTDYVGSYMSDLFRHGERSKFNPHSSRLIDTPEFTDVYEGDVKLINIDKLVVETENGVISDVKLPNKPDIRISDLAKYSKLSGSVNPD